MSDITYTVVTNNATSVLNVTQNPQTEVITITATGPQGPQGPSGEGQPPVLMMYAMLGLG